MNELVSIIVPVYNAEKYLSETLDSVLNQTHTNWECLIIDDGSTDSSKSIAMDYSEKDNRFKYYYQNNSGPSAARNSGVENSSGEYIQYLDADDVILPEMLKIMVNESKKVEQNIILYSNLSVGNNENIFETIPSSRKSNLGRDITFNDMYRFFGKDIHFIPSCVLFPKRALSGIKWDEQLSHSEDWDLYLQILGNKYAFQYVSETFVIYRNTPDSLSKNNLKTIKANYSILSNWIETNNLFYFSKRCALLYKRNIFLFLLKKTDKIIHPHSVLKNVSIKLLIFIFLIYPLTVFYISTDFVKILYRRVTKKRK